MPDQDFGVVGGDVGGGDGDSGVGLEAKEYQKVSNL